MTRAAEPMPSPSTLGRAFRIEWIDPHKGIRVGHLQPDERITQIIRAYLAGRYAQPFVIDKWGRGSYWRWICWVPRANRQAKTLSAGGNWSSAKFCISMFPGEKETTCGLLVERGWTTGQPPFPGCRLQDDWDWHRLLRQLRSGTRLAAEVARLLREDGFQAWVPDKTFTADTYKSPAQLRRAIAALPGDDWAGFQLHYAFPLAEVRRMTGPQFIEAVCAVFDELTEAINAVLEVPLVPAPSP